MHSEKTLHVELAAKSARYTEDSGSQHEECTRLRHRRGRVGEIGAEIRHHVACGVDWVRQHSSRYVLILNEPYAEAVYVSNPFAG